MFGKLDYFKGEDYYYSSPTLKLLKNYTVTNAQ